KTKLRIPDRGLNFRTESQELILPFFEKEPDWEKFHQYKFPDGREVFEVSLENATKYFPTTMRDSFPSGNAEEFVIQNIMFVKNPTENRFDPLIVRYFPTSPTSKKSFGEMNYAAIDYDWSGKIELFTYDERHFIGFEIKEGEVTSHYRLKPFEGDKKKSTANYDYTCWQTFHPVGYSVTTTNPDGTKTTHYVIERYVAQTNCSGSSGTDSYEYFYYFDPESGGPTGAQPDANGTCSTCEYGEYDPPYIPTPLKRLNCNQLKNTHGGIDKNISAFRNRYYGVTYENIITERGNVSITGLDSQAGGPLLEFRYIQDPLNPGLIIDMRHMLVIGKLGRAVGESVEFIQYLGQYESAFDDQDYYSNELGYSFFQIYGEAVKRNPTATADYIVSFLANPANRNSISSPERCKF
ncbi:MAG: hypothetical protein LPJ98_15425, partial [Cyclobacteriaceae bacterium]|nr:hypothetical protein [Cyclobacteriaceae bacterium]